VLAANNAALKTLPSTNEFRGSGLCRFALHDFVLSPQMEATINGGVAQVIALHKGTFGITNLPPITINIRLFGRFEAFKAYESRQLKGVRVWSGGAYLGSRREAVTWKGTRQEKFLQTVYHECTHAIVHEAIGVTPFWFNEGSAEYFSKVLVSRTGIAGEVWREGVWPCKRMIRENRLPRLETILSYTDSNWAFAKQHEVYAVSWSVIHFLTASPTRKQVLQKFVRRLVEAGGYLDSKETFGKLYPGGIKKMEQEWRAWLAGV